MMDKKEKTIVVKRYGISLLKEKYFTQTDLIKNGWSIKEIETLLPNPIYYENCINKNFPPTKCWKKKIVQQQEKLRRKNK